MKKAFLFISMLVLLLVTSQAQRFQITNYVEKTHTGSPQAGIAVGVSNGYDWEYGAFYQESSIVESLMSEKRKSDLPLVYEREFYGLYFAAPFYYLGMFQLKFNIRTGISNGENFIITPSLLTDFKPTKNIRLGAGIGTRLLKPTLQGSFSILF